jgi:hypothetical protein
LIRHLLHALRVLTRRVVSVGVDIGVSSFEFAYPKRFRRSRNRKRGKQRVIHNQGLTAATDYTDREQQISLIE